MAARRGGCSSLPLLLFFVLAVLFWGRDEERIDRAPDINPRRPPVVEAQPPPGTLPAPEYGIEDLGAPQDSQGTAFAVSSTGLWLTAEHVVRGCDQVGLAVGPDRAERVRDVYQSSVSDAALIADGRASRETLALARRLPEPGADGYHMGFPSGTPAVVQSRLIGPGSAVRGAGRTEPVLAWAEVSRSPEFSHGLGGISGGPTLDATGAVVGINSASSERRGRVLTTRPEAALELLRATRHRPADAPAIALQGLPDAAARFAVLYRDGVIRPVYCDVIER